MNFEALLFILIFIIPSNLISEEFSAVLIGFLGILYLIKNKNTIKYYKEIKYIYLSQIAIVLFAFLSLLHTSVFLQSLSESFIYLDVLIYFIIALNVKEKSKVINPLVITAALSSAFFSLYQGIHLNTRISGTLGYANSYALLLLCALFLSETLEDGKMILFSKMFLMLGIIFTGSRNTFFYLAVYLIICLARQKRQHIFKQSISIFIFDVVLYTLFNLLGKGFLALLFPMVFIYYYIIETKTTSKKFIYCCGIIVFISLISFSMFTNTGRRLLNTSYNSGVLQERFVYYEDSIKQIKSNIWGHGVSTFQYRQFKEQSAFYDVKYIHNSILQIAYDLGILPMLIFLALYIYGGIKIFKAKKNINYFTLYIVIFLHSLLDFDLSYAPILIFLCLIVAFCMEHKEVYKFNLKSAVILPATSFSMATVILNLIFFMGNLSLFLGNSNSAMFFYKIYANVSITDAAPFTAIGDIYLKSGNFEQAESYYYIASNRNKDDPRILWNLAYTKEKNNKEGEALEYKSMLLNYEKYNYKMYKFYYTSLKDQNLNTDQLERIYYENLKSLNPRAKYMKNQILSNFEDAVK
jgi:O-antigen ligase